MQENFIGSHPSNLTKHFIFRTFYVSDGALNPMECQLLYFERVHTTEAQMNNHLNHG